MSYNNQKNGTRLSDVSLLVAVSFEVAMTFPDGDRFTRVSVCFVCVLVESVFVRATRLLVFV